MWRLPKHMQINGKKLRNAAFFLIMLAVIAILTFRFEQQKGIKGAQQIADRRLATFNSKLFSPIDKFSYLPAIISAHPEIAETLLNPQKEERTHALSIFLAKINTSVRSSAIYVMDRDGITIASSNWREPVSFVGKNFSYRPYFQNAMKGQDTGFYGIGTASQQPGYFLPHAVVNKEDSPIGVVVVKFGLVDLDSSWDSSDGQVVVIDENEVIFLSSEKDWKYRPIKPLSNDVLARLNTTRQYTSALRSPLVIRNGSTLAGLGKAVTIAPVNNPNTRHGLDTYLVSTLQLPDQHWRIEMFTSLVDVNHHAISIAVIVVCLTTVMGLAILYGQQVIKNGREREASRLALESAHSELEEKHTELERLAKHLQEMATTDSLTGCYNRRYFAELLSKILPGIRRQGASLAVLMIDIDFFKKINDTYGHDVGDKVICAVADVIKKTAREADVLARFGGEEFVIALPMTTLDATLLAGERIREAVEKLAISSVAGEISVTVSVGAASFAVTDDHIDMAIKRSDLALYDAKHGGRNQVRCFNPASSHASAVSTS
jgi:two-component system, NtrC family, C4-dicarboxylate transport sensor histidine kinase DctB